MGLNYTDITTKDTFFTDLDTLHYTYGSITDSEDGSVYYVKRCKYRNVCRLYQVDNTVTLFLQTCLPSDCLIWICVSDPSPYTRIGYKNPYYCFKDPFGDPVESEVAMSKVNDPMFETNSRQRHNESVMDTNPSKFQEMRTSPLRVEHQLFDYVTTHIENDSCIKLDINFITKDLEYLQKLVYGGRTVNHNDNSVTQKEVSGSLHLSYRNTGFELGINTTKNFNAHDENKVRFVNGLITFHTHPEDVYTKYDIDIMYPSPSDYVSLLTYMIQDYEFEDHKYGSMPMLFSCVVTKEGVYIISINKNYHTSKQMSKLRSVISDRADGHYSLKKGIVDSILSKHKGISGFFYGKDRNIKTYYDTHCKFVGDPKYHPLGYCQVGGFDYNTTKHNRRIENLLHFREPYRDGGITYSRLEQAAKDYCLKINRRELITNVQFKNGPVLNVQFHTYRELANKPFHVYTHCSGTEYIPPQLLLNEETINDIILFSKTS